MAGAKIDIRTELHRSPEKVKDLNKAFGGMEQRAKKGGSALKGLWKQVALGVGLTVGVPALIRSTKKLANSFLNVSIQTEQYKLRLEVLLGSQKKATEAMIFFEEVASKVPFTLEEIMEAGTTVTAFGADLEKWTPILTDLAAVMGINVVDAANALGRAYAGGAGAADIFRERGILQIIKDSAKLKSGIDDITKLSLPQFRDAMFDAFVDTEGKIAGAGDKLATTWTGIISMLEDKWFKFRKTVMETKVFELLKEGLASFNKKLDEFVESGKIEEWAREMALAVLKGFQIIVEGVKGVLLSFNLLKAAVFEVGAAISRFFRKYIEQLIAGLALLSKMGAPVKGMLKDAIQAWKDLATIELGYNEVIDETTDKMSNIITFFDSLTDRLKNVRREIKETTKEQKKLTDKTKDYGITIEETALPAGKDMLEVLRKSGIATENAGITTEVYTEQIKKRAEEEMSMFEKIGTAAVISLGQSKLGAIAQATMSTYAGAAKSLELLGMPLAIPFIAMAIATGFKQVQAIMKVNIPSAEEGAFVPKPTLVEAGHGRSGEVILPLDKAPLVPLFKETMREVLKERGFSQMTFIQNIYPRELNRETIRQSGSWLKAEMNRQFARGNI